MRGKSYGGFKGGRRLQGGWITAAIGFATSLFGASKAKKQAKADAKARAAEIAAKDPYGPYRKAAAEKLGALTFDSVVDTPEYKARQTAAARLMAAQGYTGSGNAVGAAAEAGGASYQQAFDNLARQAGVDVSPGGGHNAGQDAATGQNNLNQMSGALNSAVYSAGQLLGSFNQPASQSNAKLSKGG